MLVVWASGFAQSSLSVDFESDLTTYTDWTFKNIAQSATVTPHTGTHYGNTNMRATAYVQTKNKVEAPQQLTFYISKETKNTTSSDWKIQVSTDGKTWTDVKNVNASSMKKGEWVKVTQNLEKYKNNYVRVYYNGTTAIRCIDDVTLTVAATKTATTLTFTNSTINIEEGNEVNFAAQTATLKTGETVLNNAVTYTTNNDAMFEAYEANVGPQALKVGAYGTAVVTAKFAGDDTYAASTATYTVNYTEKVKPATTLDFGFATKTVNINETFTATAALKAGEAAISGDVTYTSSKPEVATVNETTGTVSALTAGTTKITATFAGTSEYKSSTAYYYLTVVDPNALVSTFDFVNNTYGYGRTEKLNKGEIISNRTPITIVNTKNGSKTVTTFTNTDLRNYKAAILTINAAKGYLITKITMTGNRFLQLLLNDNNGTWNKERQTGEWLGSSSSVSFTNLGSDDGNAVSYYTINIEYVAVKPVTLDESQNNTETISGNADKTVNVKLTRTLKADVWNTFCVPFDVIVADSPLKDATIKQIASVEEKTDGAVINFEDAPATLEAGKAYLVRTTTAIENPTFNGVTVKNVDPTNCSRNENYQLIGIYSPKNIDASLYGKVFGINNQDKLAKVMKDTSIKGMRAYFLLANSATAAKLNFGGELTGIDAVDNGEAVMTGKVYNLNGQYVGNSLEGLKKGVYVVNGKKVLK
jgi:hypothetical protein